MVAMNLGNRMQQDRHLPRIDVVEIKFEIERALGPKKSEQYFGILNRYLSLKLSKGDFDKLCIALVGRGSICLHNSLIRAIVRNASVAKTPPPKQSNGEALRNKKVTNAIQERNLQSLCKDGFPLSQRKLWTPIQHDPKCWDHPSPLGPLGKTQINSCEDSSLKSQRQPSAIELQSLGSLPPVEVNSVEDGEEVEQAAGSPSIYSRSPVRAPLGIPLITKGTKKLLLQGEHPFSYTESCQNTSMLPDTSSLKTRLALKLGMEGLSASTGSINLLNNGLDFYIKTLVKPSMQVASSKYGKRFLHQAHPKIPVLNSMHPMGYSMKPNKSYSISMLDFKVAMEQNPRILGEDWPLKVEKIGSLASE